MTEIKKYNWKKILKRYNNLGIPSDVWTPTHIDFTSHIWNVIISIRATGKTTNLILLGLCMHAEYTKTVIQYIRQVADMITPKELHSLFNVIVENGYIEKLTNSQYNNVQYKAGIWRYVLVEDGEIKKESEPIMHCLSLDKADVYKSTLNEPYGDFIIFDEFISKRYKPNEIEDLCSVLSSITRDRTEVFYFLLANSLNYYNQYLTELGIARDIKKMEFGDKRIIKSGLVDVYTEIIDPHTTIFKSERKKLATLLKFGFRNEKLASITGSTTWNFKHYRHLPPIHYKDERKNLAYFKLNDDLFVIEICDYIFIKPSSRNIEDVTLPIYSVDVLNKDYIFAFGKSQKSKKLWTKIINGDCYFATNECGLATEQYIKNCQAERLG